VSFTWKKAARVLLGSIRKSVCVLACMFVFTCIYVCVVHKSYTENVCVHRLSMDTQRMYILQASVLYVTNMSSIT
jgi:hypothetical protein